MKIKLSDFNNNSRVYSIDAINDLLERSKINSMYGWCNTDYPSRLITDISHIIQNLEIFDDGIYGEYKILDTPRGKIVKEIGKYIDMGISERLQGSYDPTTGQLVISKILSYDLIVDGSDLLERRKKKIEKIMKNINEKI